MDGFTKEKWVVSGFGPFHLLDVPNNIHTKMEVKPASIYIYIYTCFCYKVFW